MNSFLHALLKFVRFHLRPLGVGAWMLRILAFVAIALQLGSGSATAQTTWDNTGAEWTSGTSWVGDVAPASDSSTATNIAVFSSIGAGFNTVNLSSARSIYGLVFAAGANAYTFTGNALTIRGQANAISNGSTTVQTFNNKIINANSSSGVYGSVAGGSLVFAGGIDLSSSSTARTLTFGLAGDITVSGAIADGGGSTGGGVTVTNTGLTLFSGNNTFTGASTINSGATLKLGSATALGATNGGTTVNSGGTIDLNGQAISAEALTISGTGVSSGGVIFNSSGSAASASGPVTMTASSTIKATNGSITLSGGVELVGNAASSRTLTLDGTGGLILSGNISNSFAGSTGNIAIAATASNVTLSGSNSYNGTTTLNSGGAMNINSAYAISTNTFAIGTSAFLNNTSGGAITNLGNNNVTWGDGLTFGTSGSTATNSLNLGTGTATASGSRTITIAGTGVTLGLGTLDSTSTSSARTFTANGAGNTLSLAGWKIQSGSTANVTAKLAGTADWTITGPIVNGNAFTNGVQIDATGLTTFGGNNTYDGETIVSSGATLRITSATGLGTTNTGTTVSAGGQLQLSGGITVDAGEALSLSGTTGATASLRNISGNNAYNGALTFTTGTNRIDSDAGTLTLSSFANTLSSSRSLFVGGAGNTTLTGRLTGSGTSTVTKDGSGTLTLANTNFDVGGGFIVSAGTLALATNDALGATRAVAVNGGTLDIGAFNNTVGAVSLTNGAISGSTGILTGTSYAVENGSISATLAGSGGLTKSTGGTVTLSGANTYSGTTTISGGTLAISGTNTGNGSITLAAGTTLDVSGKLLGTNSVSVNNASAVLKITQTNGLANAVLLGASSSANIGTVNLTGGGDYVVGTYGNSASGGQSMAFTNSSGLATTLTFSNATNYITTSSGNSAGRTLTNSSASLTIVFGGTALDIGSSSTNDVTFTGSGSYAVNASIINTSTGVRSIVKSGTGALTLGAANSYNGTTTISGGTVRISNGDALGTTGNGTTVTNGAALELVGGITVGAEELSLSGTGISSGGALRNISGNNTYGGTITNTQASRINSDAGTLTLSGAINANSQALIFGGAGNIAVSGAITNSSSTLTKDGTGTLTLGGANTYSGGTVVSAGELAYGADNALANSGAVTVSNATLNIGSYSDTVGAVVVTNGGRLTGTTGVLTGSSYASGGEAVTNTISANLAGSAALTLTGNTNTTVLSGSNSYSGDTTLANSTSTNMTLRVTSVNALSTNSSLVGSSAGSRLPTLDLAAAGAYTMQNYKGGNMTFLATNGASSITFVNNSVTNQITGGSRNLYATNVNVSFQGALDISPTTANKDLGFRGNGDYTLNGSIVTANTSFTAGMVVDTTGTVALNASNNYNGTTTVSSNATLLLGNNNALGTTDSGTTVLSGGALDLGGSTISGEALSVEGTGVSSGGAVKNSSASAAAFSGAVTLTAATTIATTNGNITLSGAIGQDTGSRNLTKIGASTLTLSGTSANNYLGRTTVSGGVLELNKTAGVDAIAGAVTVNSTATLLISASDQVNNSSAITLSGGTITRASGVSETFGNLNVTVASTLNFGSGAAGSLAFGTYSRDTESALLTVQNFFQGNSLVFSQDLVTSGLIASSSSGNYDNGYFAFADGFTTSWDSGTSTFTITAIPEPSTFVAAAGLLGLMLWPARRRLLKDAKSLFCSRNPPVS